MPNYENAKIYKLFSPSKLGLVYYGSTTGKLSVRLGKHKSQYKRWQAGKINYYTSFKIFAECDDYVIELAENCPRDNKKDLHERERYYIEHNKCLNRCTPNQTPKEWYQKNKAKISTQHREYRQNNKAKISAHMQGYYIKNKAKILTQKQGYYIKNKAKLSARTQGYYIKNKAKILTKVECPCGSVVSKCSIARHRRSKKHQIYQEQQEILNDFP
jgi:hypothetical protein